MTLLPGIHVPLHIPQNRPGLIVAGAGIGKTIIRGSGRDGCAIRAEDGSHGLQLRGFTLRGPATHGAWITVADDLVIEDVQASGYEREAVLTGHCARGQYRRLELFGGTGDDHSHALYVSGKASGTLIELSHFYGCPGSAIQLNSASLGKDPETDLIDGATVKNCILEDCGGDGTPLLSLMGVVGSTFDSLALKAARAGLITMFADGRGSDWACYRNTFSNIAVAGNPGFGVHELEGSGGGRAEDRRGANVTRCWTGWVPRGVLPCPAPAPTVPPAPTPPAPPPPPVVLPPPGPSAAAVALAKADAAAAALVASLAEVRAAIV